jgi:hypothetical protein
VVSLDLIQATVNTKKLKEMVIKLEKHLKLEKVVNKEILLKFKIWREK